MASANKSLARFDLAGLAAAPRGMPQIEVTFDIDANGIMHVSALDKATGKEQKIEIKAGSGLSDDEIDRMVRDAELHAEEDRKFQEVVTARNNADAIVHATRTSLKELGDKISDDERKSIESAMENVEEAMKGDDKEAIDGAVEKLSEAAQVIYQKAAEQEQAQQEPSADAGSADDDVVDAEFEEVDEDKKDG
jgi:molecular chaperone DnaK